MLKVSIGCYGALFLGQLIFYFLAPSFYVSSPDHLNIPTFIIGTFLKHFLLIAILYILWGALLGLGNGLLLKINRPLWENKRKWWPLISLCLAQFLASLLFLAYHFPSILNNYPFTSPFPLWWTYGVLALGILLASTYFLKTRTQALQRGIPQVILSLALPLFLLSTLLQRTELNLPHADALNSKGQNILLLGMDALDGDTGNHFLKKRLSHNPVVMFENAFTPLPLTHPAWNSILSGLYPKHHGVRYFFDSPHESKYPELFLPRILKTGQDYASLFASDQPETSYFTHEQGFKDSVLQTIGWEAHMVAMLINHFIFPTVWLNNPYTDRILPDRYNYAGLFNYDYNRFINRTFAKLQNLGSKPKFLALHSCYLHTPVRLSRRELAAIPDYWKLAPRDINFKKWPKPGQPQVNTPSNWVNPYFIRRDTALLYLEQLIDELEAQEYFKNHTIVFLSDHGERFVKDREIYGGVHGVDLKTREQTNVVMTFLDPRFDGFQTQAQTVSLIDVAPTLVSLLEIPYSDLPFDGQALLDSEGKPREIASRSIMVESMGYINDAEEQVKFPQIAVKTLEESLIYGVNGEVTIGEEYYARILKKKTFEDFSKALPDPVSELPSL